MQFQYDLPLLIKQKAQVTKEKEETPMHTIYIQKAIFNFQYAICNCSSRDTTTRISQMKDN